MKPECEEDARAFTKKFRFRLSTNAQDFENYLKKLVKPECEKKCARFYQDSISYDFVRFVRGNFPSVLFFESSFNFDLDSKVDFYPIFQGIRGVCRTFQAKANQIRGDTM